MYSDAIITKVTQWDRLLLSFLLFYILQTYSFIHWFSNIFRIVSFRHIFMMKYFIDLHRITWIILRTMRSSNIPHFFMFTYNYIEYPVYRMSIRELFSAISFRKYILSLQYFPVLSVEWKNATVIFGRSPRTRLQLLDRVEKRPKNLIVKPN